MSSDSVGWPSNTFGKYTITLPLWYLGLGDGEKNGFGGTRKRTSPEEVKRGKERIKMNKKLGSMALIGMLVTIGIISVIPKEAASETIVVSDLEIGGLAPVSPGSSRFEATVTNHGPAGVDDGDTITVEWSVDGETEATTHITDGLQSGHSIEIEKTLSTTVGRHEVGVEVFPPNG